MVNALTLQALWPEHEEVRLPVAGKGHRPPASREIGRLGGSHPFLVLRAGLSGACEEVCPEVTRSLVLVLLSVLTALFAAAGPAQAQGLSTTVYVGGSIPLSIPVTASVGGRCQFATGSAPNGTYDAGAIDTTAWTHDFAFTIDCNTASRVAVVSTNGGLKTSSLVTTGYTALAPYDVGLNLQGNATNANASCAVSTLAASASTACSFRGPSSSTVGLRLTGASQNQTGSYLRVSAPAYSGSNILVAGQYADTLTVTISAAP